MGVPDHEEYLQNINITSCTVTSLLNYNYVIFCPSFHCVLNYTVFRVFFFQRYNFSITHVFRQKTWVHVIIDVVENRCVVTVLFGLLVGRSPEVCICHQLSLNKHDVKLNVRQVCISISVHVLYPLLSLYLELMKV